MKFYPDIYKSDDFLAIKNALINYCFGLKVLNMMHSDSVEKLVSAELE